MNPISKSNIIFSIGEEFQIITDRATSVPPNTSELMELTEFVHKAETEMMKNLENKLRDSIKFIIFISDFHVLTNIEIKANNSSFLW